MGESMHVLARLSPLAAGLAVASLVLVVATAPSGTRAADHLDAPNLAAREDADINDVYVFQASDPSRTVIAVTTSPAAGVIGPIDYATNVRYKISVDRDGDAVPDLAYVFDFDAPSGGTQSYTVTRYKGENARTLEHGKVLGTGMRGEATPLKEHSLAFAGLRADPFFFDLNAFKHVVLGANNGRTGFCDQAGGAGIDFFAPLNTNAMVLEVPDRKLGKQIGVWATTIDRESGDRESGDRESGQQLDQMGRPAINTVFNHTVADKEAFNVTPPGQQRTALGGRFRTNVITTLQALGGYDASTAAGIADLLLPDVLTYDTATAAAGPLHGRPLADDVIDVELGLVTHGAIKTDCVGPHTYLTTFPYLNVPH